ncbi:MAG TPA: C2H2 type zinc finger domain-containing protein [Thermoplasmata archaeon]|nr:C2H2 type zinc finger domain-containing protein [Thermoplasmata archaeon]
MTKCPVCRTPFGPGASRLLSDHFLAQSARSDPGHVRFLNQSISRHRMDAEALAARFEELFRLPPDGLTGWIRQRFIARFFGPRLHPFVEALQYPTRPTLLGYVVEHQHFLREWVRCCAFVLAKSDRAEVADYELDNIRTEYAGAGPEVPSHYELLLRMGESYGLERAAILGTDPLPTTARTLAEWHDICEKEHWVEAMAAMHSLELIAHRDLLKFGATVHYFDPEILDGTQITDEAKAFLREGYEADVDHADHALALVERYAVELGRVEEVQGTFLRSLDLFDDYLGARLQRGEDFGPPA